MHGISSENRLLFTPNACRSRQSIGAREISSIHAGMAGLKGIVDASVLQLVTSSDMPKYVIALSAGLRYTDLRCAGVLRANEWGSVVCEG